MSEPGRWSQDREEVDRRFQEIVAGLRADAQRPTDASQPADTQSSAAPEDPDDPDAAEDPEDPEDPDDQDASPPQRPAGPADGQRGPSGVGPTTPSDQVRPARSDRVNPPPADRVERPPADRVNPPPADRVERPPADRVNPPPADRVERPPADRVDRSPSDRINPSPWPERRTRGHSHLGPGTPDSMATDHRSYEMPDDDDHFVPPEPPPLPAGDLHFWAIVIGLVGGPLLLLFSAVIPMLPRGWSTVGLLVSVAGFVLLILRQPRRRGPDDGGMGAQV